MAKKHLLTLIVLGYFAPMIHANDFGAKSTGHDIGVKVISVPEPSSMELFAIDLLSAGTLIRLFQRRSVTNK